jgi:hypothetical protein
MTDAPDPLADLPAALPNLTNLEQVAAAARRLAAPVFALRDQAWVLGHQPDEDDDLLYLAMSALEQAAAELSDAHQVEQILEEARRAADLATYRDQRAHALSKLAGRPGLAWTRLGLGYLVAMDGVDLGTVNPHRTAYVGGRRIVADWTARPTKASEVVPLGPFPRLGVAAAGLARHAGHDVPDPPQRRRRSRPRRHGDRPP